MATPQTTRSWRRTTRAQRPIERAAERPADRPADRPAGRAADRPANRPVHRPANRLADRTAARPASSPACSPAGSPAHRSAERHTDPRLIHVSGYPVYTEERDLVRTFSKYGKMDTEKMTEKYAVFSCETEQMAQKAIAASNLVNIYGSFLTVKPFTGKLETLEPQTPTKEFPRSKEKSAIVDPSQLDLSGDFHSQLTELLQRVRLTQDEVQALAELYSQVEAALWPGCVTIPFGSITTGLGIKSSDADCFVQLPPAERRQQYNIVNRAKRLLQQRPALFAEILAIPRANTPIVKFFHIPTNTNCDLSFKTPLGVQNSKLITFLLHCDPKLLPVAVIIKYWAKVHDISGSGKLTNYALTMLFIFYLQQPPMSILPSVEWLQRDPAYDFLVDCWNTGFMNDKSKLPPTTNTSSISELLGGFFEFYATFNFEEMAICPFIGYPIKKECFKDLASLPKEFTRYKENVKGEYTLPLRFNTAVCIQDPFEQCHNVASGTSPRMAADMKSYFEFAANAYEKEKLNNCENFLRIILLEKPIIKKIKKYPEFRVILYPNVICSIVDSDWKSRVREVVFKVFERILKLSLGKVEVKSNPETKREKESYMSTMQRAIWKRKKFYKLYKAMKLDFLEREERITEEVLRIEKTQIEVEFQVIVTYCHDPKSSVVSVKFINGDIDSFKNFGRFYATTVHYWYMNLLKCYTTQPDNKTETDVLQSGDVETNELSDKDIECETGVTDDINVNSDSYNVSVDKSLKVNDISEDTTTDNETHDDQVVNVPTLT